MAALRAEMELKTRQLADAWGMLDVANGELDAARARDTAHADELKTLREQLDAKAGEVNDVRTDLLAQLDARNAEVDKVRDDLDTARAELAAAGKSRELLDAVAGERDDARAREAEPASSYRRA